ncbi:MAG: polysaccharide biosynthesis C-terminal domain-containing protein, partial [Solirubrobacterales bacterium]
ILLLGLGIEGLLLGTSFAAFVTLPLLWREALGRGVRVWFAERIDWRAARAAFAYGMPLVVSNLAVWILSLSGRYVIGLFRGAGEVGVYSLSYNIADKSIMLLVTLFLMASGPISMRIWENDGEQESKRFVIQVTRLYLLACVPLVVGLSVLSRLVVDVMAGDEYAEGYRIMPYVLSGVLLVGIEQRYQSGLLFHKKTGLITASTILAGLLNVFLNVLFVPRYGYFAAGVAAPVSYAALLLLTARFSRRVFVWRFPWRSLFNVALASAMMGIVIHLLNSYVGLAPAGMVGLCLCAGAIVYGAVLLALGEFPTEELRSVCRALSEAIFHVRRIRGSDAAVRRPDAEEIL